MEERIIKHLTDTGPATVAELAADLEAKYHTVERVMRDLAAAGKVQRGAPRSTGRRGRPPVTWEVVA